MTRRRRSASPHPIGAGLIAAALAFLAIAFGVLSPPSSGPAHTVIADVASSGDLTVGDPVRVSGVPVGRVADLDLDPDGRGARVTLDIEKADVVVHADARLWLRWRTVLGGALYVDLDPGTPAAAPLGDHVLPHAQTHAQVELDDVTSILGGRTPDAVRTSLRELATGLGDPAAVPQLLTVAPHALRSLADGAAPLQGSQSGDLSRLLASSARVVATLDADRPALADLVDGGADTLGTVAAHRQPLGAALDGAPRALAATDALLRRLGTTLDRLDPVASALRPGLSRLAEDLPGTRRTLTRITRTARTATPLLRTLPRSVSAFGTAAARTSTLMAAAQPLLDKTRASILPWLDERDPATRLKTYEAIGPTFAVATHAEFDNGGFFLPFPADVDEGGAQDFSLTGSAMCSALLARPTATERERCTDLQRMFGGRLRIKGKPR